MFSENVISNNKRGIDIQSSPDNEVRNNNISNNLYSGIYATGGKNRLLGNSVNGSTEGKGIFAGESKNTIFREHH